MENRPLPSLVVAVLIVIGLSWCSLRAQEEPGMSDELFFQPIETVITAGGTEQNIERAPATVTVISADEIKASGALSIPEVLRFVPGLDVMTITSSHAEVNARGLNQLLSNKLLVLVDGRSVYFDFYGGVIWEGLPVLLEQIDRIEVVRSPSSALYGANAFSGVINIITKAPRQLHGGHLSVKAGELSSLFTSYIQGNRTGNSGYRFAVGSRQVNSFRNDDEDSEDVILANGLFEHRFDNDVKLSLEGGVSYGSIVQVVRIEPNKFDATTTYGKLNLDYGNFSLQTFWNRGDETGDPFFPPGDDIDIVYNTLDIELQNMNNFGRKHTLIYGSSYRLNTIESSMIDEYHNQNLFAAYVQEEYRPVPQLSVLAGVRLDYHPLAGVNLSPRASIILAPDGKHTFRAGVSRAFRNPSFSDSYINVSTPVDPMSGLSLNIIGEPDLDSEKMTNYEFAYTYFPNKNFRGEVDVFYYDFKDYIGTGTPQFSASGFPVQSFVNLGSASAKGFEITADFIPAGWLKFSTNYSYTDLNNNYTITRQQAPPTNKLNLKLFVNLPGSLSVSLLSSFVDKTSWEIPILQQPGYTLVNLDSYNRLDARIGYSAFDSRLELFVNAYNLADERVQEHPLAETIRRRVIAGFNYNY